MRRVLPLALIALTATPAIAQERMTRTACQEAYARITDMTHPDDPKVEQQMQFLRVTPDGWCQFKTRDPGFEDWPFEEIDWRMDGSAQWRNDGIPPLAMQVRIRGLDPDEMEDSASTRRPLVDAEITLRQIPDAGLLVLENMSLSNSAGDILIVSGVFERVFLSSNSMMQVSMGSATFKAGLLSLTLEGTHENPFGFYIDVDMQSNPQLQRDAAFDLISNMPDGVINDASRAELTAYAGDLPKPVGTLDVTVNSERGLGMMQIGMAAYNSFSQLMDDDAISNEMEILFDGLSISADWSPSTQVAD